MTRLQDKAQALTKQFFGEMIGDGKLVEEGRQQEQDAKRDEAAQGKPQGKPDHPQACKRTDAR